MKSHVIQLKQDYLNINLVSEIERDGERQHMQRPNMEPK